MYTNILISACRNKADSDGVDGGDDGGIGNQSKRGNKTTKGKGKKRKAPEASTGGVYPSQTHRVRKNKKEVSPKSHYTRAYARKLEAATSDEEANWLKEEEKRQTMARLEEKILFQKLSKLDAKARRDAKIRYRIKLEKAAIKVSGYFKYQYDLEQELNKRGEHEAVEHEVFEYEKPEDVQVFVKIGETGKAHQLGGLQEAIEFLRVSQITS